MTCHCFVKHAVTPDERDAAAKMLDRSRDLGDTQGIIIALTALTGDCPTTNKSTKIVRRAVNNNIKLS